MKQEYVEKFLYLFRQLSNEGKHEVANVIKNEIQAKEMNANTWNNGR